MKKLAVWVTARSTCWWGPGGAVKRSGWVGATLTSARTVSGGCAAGSVNAYVCGHSGWHAPIGAEVGAVLFAPNKDMIANK